MSQREVAGRREVEVVGLRWSAPGMTLLRLQVCVSG